MGSLRVGRPSPALIVAVVALIVALGGGAYAAISVPKNSVGTKQLKDGAVTPSKVKARQGSLVRGFATIDSDGTVIKKGGSVVSVTHQSDGPYCFDLGASVTTAVVSLDAGAPAANARVSVPAQLPCEAPNTDAEVFLNSAIGPGLTNGRFYVAFF
jgi:hypothetical protein